MSWEKLLWIDHCILLHPINDLVVLQRCESICAPIVYECVAIDPLFVNYVMKFIDELPPP